MLTWKKQKPKSNEKGRETAPILPHGFFTYHDGVVTINTGLFEGIQFTIGKIKFRQEVLTNSPQLLYDYKIVEYAGSDPNVLDTSEKLSRIIGAIVVDLLADEIFIRGTNLEINQ